jgi:hypothetical protein
MAIETGDNYVTLSGSARGHDPRERRYVTFTIDTPDYCVCTGNIPFNVDPGDMEELQAELGKLIARARARGMR